MGKTTRTKVGNSKPRILSVSYEAELLEDLKNNQSEAAAYLSVSIADEDPRIFMLALDHVVRANGGLTLLAKKTGINLENSHRSSSPNDSMKLHNVKELLHSLGMKLSVERIESQPVHHPA